jgi:hypothetical protein
MNISNIGIPIFSIPIEEHYFVKEKALRLIEGACGTREYDENNEISKTDYFLDVRVEPEYGKFLLPILFPYIYKTLNEFVYSCDVTIRKYWYQQYLHTENHKLHIHGDTTWACVYYLELPYDGPKTTFQDILSKNYYTPTVGEGEILLFPACLPHTSLPNNSHGRKTVVVCNVFCNL